MAASRSTKQDLWQEGSPRKREWTTRRLLLQSPNGQVLVWPKGSSTNSARMISVQEGELYRLLGRLGPCQMTGRAASSKGASNQVAWKEQPSKMMSWVEIVRQDA